jgi:hypothetical protein
MNATVKDVMTTHVVAVRQAKVAGTTAADLMTKPPVTIGPAWPRSAVLRGR